MLSTSIKFSSQIRRPTRYESVGSDNCRFIGTKEYQRSFPRRGGGGTMLINNTPSASLVPLI